MYVPPHARESRFEILAEAIGNIGFGTLVTVGNVASAPGPQLTHLPMMLVDGGAHGTLIGHVARANPHHETPDGAMAVASFVGPQFYVSASAYATKGLTHKVVPTWDYIAVEARGPISFVRDAVGIREIVKRLTSKFEADRKPPWRLDDAPAEYIETLLGAIVGFELRITSLEGAYKLSRNANDADRAGVADLAAQSPDPSVAALAGRIRTRT